MKYLNRKGILKILYILFFIIILNLNHETTVSAETETPENPLHYRSNGHYTEWSYLYFGSYPQTEVVEDALTEEIMYADYDSNGDAWINGTKYRRISIDDTTNGDYFGNSEWRYFKWEVIKWRILKKNGSSLFVMADQGLDCKVYNERKTQDPITWEDCTLRTWMNEVFYNTAFSSREQSLIVRQTVENSGAKNGNDTQDNIYLLSIDEVSNPEYGFCSDSSMGGDCVGRWVQASDYTHAMGGYTYSGNQTGGNLNAYWWLRSSGIAGYASAVHSHGHVNEAGSPAYNTDVTVVPVLNIDLSAEENIPIVVSPKSKTVEEGDTVTFTVSTSGWNLSDCIYQWYCAESLSGSGTEINEATASSYIISRVNEEVSEKYYYCIVRKGEYEAVSSRAKLSMFKAPTVAPLASKNAKEGESVTFSVRASGGIPSSYTYQWYYATSQSETGIKISGATSSYYTISSNNVTLSLNGRYYYCVVSNGRYDVTSSRAKLTIYSAPNVTSLTSKSVKAGTGATFTVGVSGGNPTSYTYQWYYATSISGAGTKIIGATSSAYTITAANMISSLNGRYYYCVVSNG